MASAISVTAEMKLLFFDTEAVIRETERKERTALIRIGSAIRRTARSSIRSRKRKPRDAAGSKGRKGLDASRPGSPPLSWEKEVPNLRTIFFVYDASKKSVFVGPLKLQKAARNGTSDVPGVLESGGVAEIIESQYRAGERWYPGVPKRRGPNVKTRKRRASYQARPFMGPALDANQGYILNQFDET